MVRRRERCLELGFLDEAALVPVDGLEAPDDLGRCAGREVATAGSTSAAGPRRWVRVAIWGRRRRVGVPLRRRAACGVGVRHRRRRRRVVWRRISAVVRHGIRTNGKDWRLDRVGNSLVGFEWGIFFNPILKSENENRPKLTSKPFNHDVGSTNRQRQQILCYSAWRGSCQIQLEMVRGRRMRREGLSHADGGSAAWTWITCHLPPHIFDTLPCSRHVTPLWRSQTSYAKAQLVNGPSYLGPNSWARVTTTITISLSLSLLIPSFATVNRSLPNPPPVPYPSPGGSSPWQVFSAPFHRRPSGFLRRPGANPSDGGPGSPRRSGKPWKLRVSARRPPRFLLRPDSSRRSLSGSLCVRISFLTSSGRLLPFPFASALEFLF